MTAFFFSGYFRGKKQYEPPKYMTINTAIEQLLEVERMREENGRFKVFVLAVWFCICKIFPARFIKLHLHLVSSNVK